MTIESKKNSLVQLFNGFPAASKMDLGQAALMAASYLEILQPFSSQVVSAACDVFRKRPSAFPPSSGELYAECDKIDRAEKSKRDWIQAGAPRVRFNRLPPPKKRGWTLEQLADFSLVINGQGDPYVMRVDADGNPLRIPDGLLGAGKTADYGYLTTEEARLARERRASAAAKSAPRRPYSEAAE